MAISLDVRIDDSEFRTGMARLRSAATDLSPALRAIVSAFVTSTKFRFRSGAGPDGIAWKPSKRAIREGGKTLVLSARLMESISVGQVAATFADWGTNVVYAAIHQLGGVINRAARTVTIYRRAGKDGIEPGFVKKRHSNFAQDFAAKAYRINMPARPFLGVDQADVREGNVILAGFLAKAVGGAK